MKRTFFRLLLLLLLAVTADVTYATVSLPHIIASHMVLQQNDTCNIWGWASVGENVEVKASWGESAKTVGDAQGNWSVRIRTPKAGGPYEIEFVGSNYMKLTDVMIGEVFIASGQSNMELPMAGWLPSDTVPNAAELIRNSTNDNIRFIPIKQKAAFFPEKDADGWWTKVNPQTATYFSALAYLYAKKLNEQLGVPVGIVQCCWSGSNCESWTSIETCRIIPSLKDEVAEFDRCWPLQKSLEDWIKSHPIIYLNTNNWNSRFAGIDFHDKDLCCKFSYDDSDWKSMKLPAYIDNREGMGPFDGFVWFRKWITVPGSWVGKKLILSLGPVDDMDVAFVNGEKVGETLEDGKWNYARNYEVSPELVRGGDMLIAVRLIDNGNGGGFSCPKEQFCIYPQGEKDKAISLEGEWKYLPTCEIKDGVYYYYDCKKLEYYKRPNVSVTLSNKTISGLYNAMLYPVIRYTAAGVLWAQGESNVGRAAEYMKLFPALVNEWRTVSGNPGLKFYYTQLIPHPYNGGNSERFREAQRRLQYEVPGCGMACALEFGSYYGFQFWDRQTMADRLFAWASHDLYGKDCEVCGPELSSFIVNKTNIELTFTHTTGGMVSKDGKELRNFELVDSKGNAFPAKATVSGDKIILTSDKCPAPKNARYAYHDWVEDVNFYNGAGFPASSFTTEKKVSDN